MSHNTVDPSIAMPIQTSQISKLADYLRLTKVVYFSLDNSASPESPELGDQSKIQDSPSIWTVSGNETTNGILVAAPIHGTLTIKVEGLTPDAVEKLAKEVASREVTRALELWSLRTDGMEAGGPSGDGYDEGEWREVAKEVAADAVGQVVGDKVQDVAQKVVKEAVDAAIERIVKTATDGVFEEVKRMLDGAREEAKKKDATRKEEAKKREVTQGALQAIAVYGLLAIGIRFVARNYVCESLFNLMICV